MLTRPYADPERSPRLIQMSPQRREMILKIADGARDPFSVLVTLELITHHVRADEIFSWLCRHRITGKNYEQAFQVQWKFSPKTLMDFVVQRLDKAQEVKPILMGKDFI